MEAPPTVAADGHVTLEIPARAPFVRVARLVASGIGTTAGMDIDDVDDLRIAVDELCSIAIDAVDAGPVLLDFTVGSDHVAVSGSVRSGWADGAVPDSARWLISEQILAVVADELDVRVAGGRLSFSMVKRRRDR